MDNAARNEGINLASNRCNNPPDCVGDYPPDGVSVSNLKPNAAKLNQIRRKVVLDK